MPRIALSIQGKAENASKLFPKEFTVDKAKNLFCIICHIKVNCEKTFNIEAHRKTSKHQSGLAYFPKQPKLTIKENDEIVTFSQKVTEAFISADIPLHKLQNVKIRDLFLTMKHPLPSETTCRRNVDIIYSDIILKIKSIISKKKIFLVFDETTIRCKYYSNILVGLVENPSVTYLINCQVHERPLTANIVTIAIDEIIKEYEINRNDFLLLLSDAARYMTAAGATLKVIYPNLFHVLCVSHLMHNCAMKVRSYFSDIDKLIASIKLAITKNRTRRLLFLNIGQLLLLQNKMGILD